MKKTILYILLLSFTTTNAQFGPQQVISTDIGGARAVFTADIDGDGDLDVLSASNFDDKVSWFENLDGLGTFGEEQIIDDNLLNSTSVFASDIDNDGDMDVVSVSWTTDKVTWYNNTDGLGNFGSQQIITSNADGVLSIYVADLDGDGNNDVVSASHLDNKVAWYKNDGLGNFGPQLIITNNALSIRQVITSDIDGDNDIDVIYAENGGDRIIWQENIDGLGNFGPQRIIVANANGALSVFAADIDGDGDIDLFSASPVVDKVDWHENLDGLGNFGPPQNISTDPEGERFVFGSDIDNDGDMDLITCYQTDNNVIGKVLWYENLDGLGSFGTQQIISSEVEAVRGLYAADIDSDGDMDVFSASLLGANIAWYENYTILGVEENSVQNTLIYPNPVQNTLYINTNNNTIKNIEIYTILGKRVLLQEGSGNRINISKLQAGLYLVKIKTNNGVLVKKVIKK